MELKQLEYFAIVCEKGSFNQAASCLYTSQPNVSRVIHSLEAELGRKLFLRSNRGLEITPYGETVREYASIILKHSSLIRSMASHSHGKKFTLSTYPSNMISRLLADFYNHWGQDYVVEHQEGSVEEVSDWVANGVSEIGIAYVAQKQLKSFQHILSHKKLVFHPLDIKEACIYVGPHNPFYEADSIAFSHLSSLRFLRGVRDYFSMDHHLSQVSLGVVDTHNLQYACYSNSDHTTINLLLHTDLCMLGIDFLNPFYRQYDIKILPFQDCEPFLVIGAIYPEGQPISEAAHWFLEQFQAML